MWRVEEDWASRKNAFARSRARFYNQIMGSHALCSRCTYDELPIRRSR